MDFMEAVKVRCLGKTVMDTDKKYKLEGTGSNIEIYDMETSEFKKLNKYIVQLNWITVEEEKPSREQCNDTDHLKIELIQQIIGYEHKTGCFEAWLLDLRGIINHTLNKYKP